MRRGRKLRREPHRPFCTRHFYSLTRIHNLPFSFPLPLTFFPPSPVPPPGLQMPSTSRSALCTRTSRTPRSPFFLPSSKGKTQLPTQAATHPAVLRFEKLGRFYALRPRAIHAAVMATQRLWGSPRAKPPPCTMGKHDQYLNPPRYAFPLRDACLSLDDLLSLSLFFSPSFGLSILGSVYRVESTTIRPFLPSCSFFRSLGNRNSFVLAARGARCLFIFFFVLFFDITGGWPRVASA